jgi:hypothetical protein
MNLGSTALALIARPSTADHKPKVLILSTLCTARKGFTSALTSAVELNRGEF